MEIEGQRVLITGAGRGLGRVLVNAFLEAGAAEVVAGVRKPEDHEALKSERVTPVQLDVRSDTDVNALATLDTIDILINNAGVAGFGNPLTMDFKAIEEEMAVNYLGVMRVTRAIAPGMVTQHRGMIVNVATAFAKVNLPLVGRIARRKRRCCRWDRRCELIFPRIM